MLVELIDCVKGRKSAKEIVDLINSDKPDFCGINIFTQNYDIVKYIFENVDFKGQSFIGGQAVKSIYNDILTWNVKNRLNIVIGEGEFILSEIALGICQEAPMITKGNKSVYKVDKNSRYYPREISNILLNRKFLSNEIVVNHYGEKEAAIITSRGCMYDCAFCGGAKSFNEDITIRVRKEESIIKEIAEILQIHSNVNSIRILDDLFLRNLKSIEMARHIFESFPQLSWRGMVHVLSLAKNLNCIPELTYSRCKELFLGIESGSLKIRKKINKLGSIEDIINVSRKILENGIDLKAYFIYGFPNETRQDFLATYELAKKLTDISRYTSGSFRTSVFQFRPYHGTQLYNKILLEGGIIKKCSSNDSINQMKGRAQFNFDFGNYSEESDATLNDFIIKTQRLTEVIL
jgi:radical SAM superfamily enzyme YgiQ (UPF0313 family)